MRADTAGLELVTLKKDWTKFENESPRPASNLYSLSDVVVRLNECKF